MALKGTLKDFGIADILQFIGQQQRSGILHLKAKQNETSIGFKNGAIVSVENSKRKSKDLLGKLLVRYPDPPGRSVGARWGAHPRPL
jgi:hypothetical protein